MKQDEVLRILEGSYDLHIHPIPSHVPRCLDDFELVEQAASYQMAGVMIKNHYESTAARAALVNRRMSHLCTRAYGGVVLNWPAGGLNPYAAESALKLGASFVWMPTRDSAHCLKSGDMPGDFFTRPGISVIDEEGKLLPVVYDIFDVIKKYDAVLATGHLSPAESMMLCKAGRKAGIHMVLTHPEWERTQIDAASQKEMADLGVWIEKNWYNIAEGNCSAEQMAANIKAVGAHRIFLATDRGQAGKETPVEGYIRFIKVLHDQGIPTEDLITMAQKVPAELLNRSIP